MKVLKPLQNSTTRMTNAVTQEQSEFIWAAVEANWTTPRIAAELPELRFATVLLVARQARQELRERFMGYDR